jgi:hypothetical protein
VRSCAWQRYKHILLLWNPKHTLERYQALDMPSKPLRPLSSQIRFDILLEELENLALSVLRKSDERVRLLYGPDFLLEKGDNSAENERLLCRAEIQLDSTVSDRTDLLSPWTNIRRRAGKSNGCCFLRRVLVEGTALLFAARRT